MNIELLKGSIKCWLPLAWRLQMWKASSVTVYLLGARSLLRKHQIHCCCWQNLTLLAKWPFAIVPLAPSEAWNNQELGNISLLLEIVLLSKGKMTCFCLLLTSLPKRGKSLTENRFASWTFKPAEASILLSQGLTSRVLKLSLAKQMSQAIHLSQTLIRNERSNWQAEMGILSPVPLCFPALAHLEFKLGC